MNALNNIKLKGERACSSHSDSIEGEIKSVTKIVTQKLGFLVYWGYWNSKISLSLVLLKIVTLYFTVE